MFVYFYGKIVDKRADMPVYLSSSAVSAYLRIIKIKFNKEQKCFKNPEITGVFLTIFIKLSD